jgi:hypothetical protein
MIKLPKITRIKCGTQKDTSGEFLLGNYKTLAFLFENTADTKMAVTANGNIEGGTAKAIPFLFKAVEAGDFEEVGADGKIVTEAGAFLAVVTDGCLAKSGLDRVSVTLEVDTGTVASAYALQDAPRYTGDGE